MTHSTNKKGPLHGKIETILLSF